MGKPQLLLLSTILLCGAVGCTDLTEVAALGDVAARARTALPIVSEDFAHSCERQSALQTRLVAGATLAVPLDCKPYKELSAHLAKDQNVLTDYLDALAKLASDKGYTYATSASGAETTIAGLAPAAGANAALVADAQKAGGAAVGLAAAMTGIVLRHARERDARKLILASNGAVQALTAALGTVVGTDYKTVLGNEESGLKDYYESPLTAPHADPLVSILVQRQYDTDTAAMERRRDAAADYLAVMQLIGATHAKLAAAAGQPETFLQVMKTLGPDLSDLRDAVVKLQTEVN